MTPKRQNNPIPKTQVSSIITPWQIRQEAINRIKRQVDVATEHRAIVSRVAFQEIAHVLAIQPDQEDRQLITGEPWLTEDILATECPLGAPRTGREEIHDFIGRYGNYADYYENWELICLAVYAAESFTSPLTADPALGWQDAEPAVRELASLCGKHKLTGVADSYGKPDGSTILHIGACIDCWCQATGIDVPNPTGVWEIRTGAEALGWKNPRRARP